MIRAAVLAWALALGAVVPGRGEATRGDTIPPQARPVPRDSVPQDTLKARDLREQVLQKLRAVEAASRPAPARETAADAAGDSAVVAAEAAGVAGDTSGATADSARVMTDSVAAVPALDPERAPGDTAGADPAPVGPRKAQPLASGVIMGADSLAAMLRALEGYVVTEYRAASARFDAESGRLDLRGEPSLVRGAESMTADSLLSYEQKTSIICGYGKPVLSGTGSDPVESEEVCYDVDRQVGVAVGARTTFSQQGTWYVHGNEFYTSGTDRLYGSAASFTSCDLEVPHYHFAAREMKVVHDHIMVARNVTLKFGDVPVLWLPFLIQSLKPDRRSGLLTPTLGLQHVVRTSSNYRREIRDIGFYWSINDHLGVTTAMDWQSGGYTALSGRIQYKWLRQFLGGDISFSRYWMAGGGTNFTLSGGSNWQPGERTTLQASVRYSSSNDFVRDYSVDPDELNRSIGSTVGLNHRFDWGSLSLNGSRQQHLSNDQVDLTLPSATLTLNPITLFPATADPRWYNNATWQSSANFSARSREVNVLHPGERGQGSSTLTGNASSRLSLGKLSWQGSFDFNEDLLHPRPARYDSVGVDTVRVDTTHYARSIEQTMRWSTSLNYTQRLIENTDLSPSISVSGGLRMPSPDSLGVTYGRVEEPTRINMGASLRTNLFGFWPGVGPYSRIRHRIEPSIGYTFSPEPEVNELQRRAFGTRYDRLTETNRITLTFNQTFEAKPAARDTADESAAGSAVEDTVTGAFGEAPPRRIKQLQPVTLLAISSSMLAYDFVRARDDFGFETTSMNHSIRSDLVQGLSLRVGHDLFRTTPGAEGERMERAFSPRLRSLETQFSLTSNSWPFRLFRSGDPAPDETSDEREGEGASADSTMAGDLGDFANPVTPGRGRSLMMSGGDQAVGTWRGDFGYSLLRPQAGSTAKGNAMLTAGIAFQPTENWNVTWRTSYSFTNHEFSDHVLSLTRDLHRWRAGFHFVRTQTGTFTFHFNVQLLDNPDIKVDYDQRSQLPVRQYR